MPKLAVSAAFDPESRGPKGRWIPCLVGGAALTAVLAVSVWHFRGPTVAAAPSVIARLRRRTKPAFRIPNPRLRPTDLEGDISCGKSGGPFKQC